MANRNSLGPRRDRIVFERRRELDEPDEKGRAVFEYQPITPTLYTDLIPIRSGEAIMAGRLGGVTGYRCQPAYHPTMERISVGDRASDLRNLDRVFRVTSILLGPERDFADIVLEEGGAV